MIKKHIISTATAVLLIAAMTVPAFAATGSLESEYEYYNGTNTDGVFNESTQYDLQVSDPYNDANIRRDKNSAFAPPPDGFFGGYVATDYINPYYNNEANRIDYTEPTSSYIGTESNYTPGSSWSPMDENSAASLQPTDNVLTDNKTYDSTSGMQYNTSQPAYYADGTIGTIVIPALNYNIDVYDNDGYYTMYYGFGLIEGTSAWDGNVALAGHNRGTPVTVGDIHKLNSGDRITYETPYGTRTYAVSSVTKTLVTDTSALGNPTAGNQLTLVTCVAGQSATYRYVVVAYEV